VGLEVLAKQGDTRPGDESHGGIQSPRTEQQRLQVWLQRAEGIRIEKTEIHIPLPFPLHLHLDSSPKQVWSSE
jgi:hypothetical protein